jgi:peptide/nickel transport system ATP-binding protein
MTGTPTLAVENLETHFFMKAGVAKAVDGVSFTVDKGEIMGLVGESGSGKTVTGFSIIGLVDPPGEIVGGKVLFKGEDIVGAPEERMQKLRGDRIAMIFQDPMMTLNPVLRIDTQMIETVLAHEDVDKETARQRSRDVLAQVGIPAAEERMKAYPHQFSGGMRQRVAIAIALLNKPDLIIADEPTTALDVTIQGQILYEAQKLCRETGTALIWITHDLAVVAGVADKISVMYAGRVVEQGGINEVLDHPVHPYTIGLLGSVPGHNTRGQKLYQIQGMAPSLLSLPKGCAFQSRCQFADGECDQTQETSEPVPGRVVRCCHPQVEAAE